MLEVSVKVEDIVTLHLPSGLFKKNPLWVRTDIEMRTQYL